MTFKFWQTSWFWAKRNNLANYIEYIAYFVRYSRRSRKMFGDASKEYNHHWF